MTNAPIAEEKPFDGVNIIPYLKGEKQGKPHPILYVRKFDEDLYSVRDGDMKLVAKKNDLANRFPEKVQHLDSLLQKWDSHLIDPIFLGLIHTERWQKRLKVNP